MSNYTIIFFLFNSNECVQHQEDTGPCITEKWRRKRSSERVETYLDVRAVLNFEVRWLVTSQPQGIPKTTNHPSPRQQTKSDHAFGLYTIEILDI